MKYIFLLALCACSTLKVTTNYDKKFDFSKVKTFSWVELPEGKETIYHFSGRVEEITLKLIELDLKEKGILLSDSKSSDVLVNYFFSEDKEIDNYSFSSYFGYDAFTQSASGMLFVNDDITFNGYSKGKFIIDVLDKKTKRVIYRGIAKKDIQHNARPSVIRKNLEKVIKKLLKDLGDK